MDRSVVIDENNVKDVIHAFENILANLEKTVEKTNKKIIEESQEYLNKQYSTRIKDENITDISTKYEKIENGYKLIAEGKDVLYEEFGTGDRGQQKPHPEKSRYNLNDYNSGQYIKNVSDYDENSYTYDDLQAFGITSGKFWRYKKGDTLYYTQGVPSGQEMWDTRNHIIKEIIPKATKELGVDILDQFERAIKK